MTEASTTTRSLPLTRTLPAVIAVFALALTGAGCSGGGGAGDASAEGREARAPVPAEREAESAASATRLATAEFLVDGMTCGGCALATEMAVKKLDGVKSADAEYDESTGEGRCTVEYDPATVGTDRIAAAIEELGYHPRLRSTTEGG